MKILNISVTIVIVMLLAACQKEELPSFQAIPPNEIPPPKEAALPKSDDLTLDFTVMALEDQITGFADNAMVEFDGKVWVVAGYNDYHPPYFSSNSDVWNSDNGVNWRSVTSNQFGARRGHTLTVFNDKMWLIGGINTDVGPYIEYDDIWTSNDGLHWTREIEHAPFGHMFYPSANVFNNRLYVIGTARSRSSQVEVWSSADGSDWRQETVDPFPAREAHQTVVFGDALYVIGGNRGGTSIDEIWKSADGIDWQRLTLSGDIFPGRANHRAVVYDNKVWVLGGEHHLTGRYADLYYSSDMEHWTQYTDLGPSPTPLSHFGALNYNDAIWVFGGYKPTEASSEIIQIKRIP